MAAKKNEIIKVEAQPNTDQSNVVLPRKKNGQFGKGYYFPKDGLAGIAARYSQYRQAIQKATSVTECVEIFEAIKNLAKTSKDGRTQLEAAKTVLHYLGCRPPDQIDVKSESTVTMTNPVLIDASIDKAVVIQQIIEKRKAENTTS